MNRMDFDDFKGWIGALVVAYIDAKAVTGSGPGRKNFTTAVAELCDDLHRFATSVQDSGGNGNGSGAAAAPTVVGMEAVNGVDLDDVCQAALLALRTVSSEHVFEWEQFRDLLVNATETLQQMYLQYEVRSVTTASGTQIGTIVGSH